MTQNKLSHFFFCVRILIIGMINMDRLIYFDASALLVLIPLFVTIITKKLYKSTSSKLFIGLAVSTLFCIIFEILSCFPNVIGYHAMWISVTGYYIVRGFMPVLYLLYVLVLTDNYVKLWKNKWRLVLVLLPYAIAFAAIIATFFTGIIYTVNIDNGDIKYSRGYGIYILYAISALYFGIALFYIIRYRLFFNIHQFVCILSIFPLTIAALLLQFLFPDFLIELISAALSLILVSSSIEAPEELIDSKTGLNSSRAFFNSVNKSGTLSKELYIVLLKLNNYSEIYNIMDLEASDKYVKSMSTIFNNRYRNITRYYRTYCIEDGLFAATFLSKENAKIVSRNLYEDLKNYGKTHKFNPRFNLCLIDLLTDFNDMDSFVAFINNFHSKRMFDNEYIVLSDIRNEISFLIQNDIDNVIETGLRNNEFEVYYQPIYDVKEKKYTSAEALIRLNSAKYGFVVPGLFISHAENNGKIIQIDNFVFREVFKFISSDDFRNLGLEYIEINLSMVDCNDKELFDRLNGLMSQYGVKSTNINLEITESLDADYDRIDNNIKKLCGLGISFSLDDYGTGYSNIERFTSLPLDIVKIDKSLADKYKDKNMEQILKNTFSMIKNLDRKIVVEGVEDEIQAKAFIDLGCDYIQGYYYSRPLPKDKFINFISEENKK